MHMPCSDKKKSQCGPTSTFTLQTDEIKVWWFNLRSIKHVSFPKRDDLNTLPGADAVLKQHSQFLWYDICTQAIDQFLWIVL